MDQTADLLKEIEEFLARTGMKPTMFGLKAIKDPSFVKRVRNGGGMTLRTAGKIREFLASHPAAIAENDGAAA
jgi:hypothetical protein